MMVLPFEIKYSWKVREKPYRFSVDEYVDVTPLVLCLEEFLSLFEGTFTIRVGEVEAVFDLKPDLSTIFEELPRMIEAITTNPNTSTDIDFYEQGTEIILRLLKKKENVLIEFIAGDTTSVKLSHLNGKSFLITTRDFLYAWRTFVLAVLDQLIKLCPGLIHDESYRNYNYYINYYTEAFLSSKLRNGHPDQTHP